MTTTSVEGFSKINDAVSIYRPATSNGHTNATSSPHNAPSLVVFCSWMGAAPKHIAKYTNGYRNLFPTAEILLIQSTIQGVFLGADISPAVDFVKAYTDDNSSRNAILHICSNGGATNASRLGSILQERSIPLPFGTMILDCCPGKGEQISATRAMAFSLPKQPVVRFVGWYFIYALIAAYIFVINATGWEDAITWIRRVLNDERIFSTEMTKLYVYSKKDALVSSEDVRAHAEDARKAGYAVRQEVFERAPHCALINEDSDRYWNSISEVVLGNRKA